MTKRWIVIDTSYILELFRVPGCHTSQGHEEVFKRISSAIEASDRLFVTAAVIFEVANHIADVSHGGKRHELALALADAVGKSLEHATPWIITPQKDRSILGHLSDSLKLIDHFANEFAVQSIGLTDVSLIHEARLLKEATRNIPVPQPIVHIWTRDGAMKAHEPDAEGGAFV